MLEQSPQNLPPGSDLQAAPIIIKKNPASDQVTEYSSLTTSPSYDEGAHHLGHIHRARHSIIVKNNTEIKLDAATMDSSGGEYYNVPSQSSRLIPEYANLHISGLRRKIIIQEKTRM